MFNRRFLLETVTLIAAAVLCATVANLLASPSRRLAWIGIYPRATELTQKSEVAEPAPIAEPATTSATLLPTTTPMEDPLPVTPVETSSAVPATEVTPNGAAPATTATRGEPAKRPSSPNASSSTSTAPTTGPAPAAADSGKTFPPHPNQPWVEISGNDAWTLFNRGATFFDARRSGEFAEGHVPGAHNISPWEGDLEQKLQKVYEMNLDPKAPIVVYCLGGNCEDSHMLAERLYGLALDNVLVDRDGFPDWQKKGRPVEKGPR
ncbi:MAG: rhodanese-like domain-containing protein [Thermoanaerobaculia bacterium]